MLLALNIAHPARQLALLLHCGGEKLHDIYDTFTIELQDEEDEYTTGKRYFDDHFMPQKNVEYETFLFHETKQQQGESLSAYHTRLIEMANRCEFEDHDRTIKSHIIRTCLNSKLRCEAVEKNLSLMDIWKHGRAVELSNAQAAIMEKPNINAMSTTLKHFEKKLTQFRGSRMEQQTSVTHGHHLQKECKLCGWPGKKQNMQQV